LDILEKYKNVKTCHFLIKNWKAYNFTVCRSKKLIKRLLSIVETNKDTYLLRNDDEFWDNVKKLKESISTSLWPFS
jgi:recombinational DNA repair protein RecR